jgi:hypothetical protein
MQDTFTRNSGEKLLIGLTVLILAVMLCSYGAVRAFQSAAQSPYSGQASNRLDAMSNDTALSALFPGSVLLSSARAGSCHTTNPLRYTRTFASKQIGYFVAVYYANRLSQLGWQHDKNSAKDQWGVFHKVMDPTTDTPWTAKVIVAPTTAPGHKTAYTVTASADPNGCDVSS